MTGRRRRTVFKALTVAFLIMAIALVVLAFGDEALIARATEPGTTGFVERPTLSDLKPGWLVSVITKHEAGQEVAEVVKVILEK